VELLRRLISERPADNPWVEQAEAALTAGLTVRTASALIDALIHMVPPTDPVAAEARRTQTSTMVNRFAGRCGGCGRSVAAREGRAVRRDDVQGGRWTVFHIGCTGERAPEPVAEAPAPRPSERCRCGWEMLHGDPCPFHGRTQLIRTPAFAK